MKYPWIEEFCDALDGAVREYKLEWDVIRYMLGDKMFIMIGEDKEKRHILTLKLRPENGEYLRSVYPDIRPGHYMNKIHWNSIDLNGSVPDEVMKNMITESYELVKGKGK